MEFLRNCSWHTHTSGWLAALCACACGNFWNISQPDQSQSRYQARSCRSTILIIVLIDIFFSNYAISQCTKFLQKMSATCLRGHLSALFTVGWGTKAQCFITRGPRLKVYFQFCFCRNIILKITQFFPPQVNSSIPLILGRLLCMYIGKLWVCHILYHALDRCSPL